MKTSVQPRILLKSIQGIKYHKMKDADRYCGSAGIYNIVESKISMQILHYKMKTMKETKATTIVTANRVVFCK